MNAHKEKEIQKKKQEIAKAKEIQKSIQKPAKPKTYTFREDEVSEVELFVKNGKTLNSIL